MKMVSLTIGGHEIMVNADLIIWFSAHGGDRTKLTFGSDNEEFLVIDEGFEKARAIICDPTLAYA